ncbi:MAG: cupin domain-containing protein [Rhodospirillaceae bacterium]|nr:cupin domain-containing protein [Rhodospirillaceae bacterium]
MTKLAPPFTEKVRRVLTSVNEAGKSYVMADNEPEDVLILNGCRMVRLWQTNEVPTTIPASTDATVPGLGRLPAKFSGTRLYTAELPQGVKISLHQGDTVDYIAVIKGQLTLGLETGETVLNPGDVVVQTGNMHAWENRGVGSCLIIVCVVGANRKA